MRDRKPLSDEDRAAISVRIRHRNLHDIAFRQRCGYLEERDLIAIRARIATGELYKLIAADFGLSTPYIAELAMNAGLARGKGRRVGLSK